MCITSARLRVSSLTVMPTQWLRVVQKKPVPRWVWGVSVQRVRCLPVTITLRRQVVRGTKTVMVLFWVMVLA
ncbi:hypothetical protein D3C87_1956000 [compost metagenome]